ncbi:MAG: ROK family glucokinase [Propionibacteriales bacterium]|nr:ROK family glucokinase [Propionibacteriales bacterium]
MGVTIGVDIGGTKIAAGVVDEKGTILEKVRRETPATDAEAIEDAIVDAVGELRGRHQVDAVGVGAAGLVDAARSTVLAAPNVAWRDEPMRTDLERALDLTVVVENDANAAAWGEFTFGAAEDADDTLLVTVGTGVGGGLVLDGELYRGAFGVAGEIGHLRMMPRGRVCGCGSLGCWEQYASGTAMVRAAREAVAAGSGQVAGLLERAGGAPEQIEGPLITSAARDGDPFAVELLAETGRWLGEGIAMLAAVLDPAVAILGGGVSAAGDLILEPAREAFAANLTFREYRPILEIRLATLGGEAGLIGAADLARH